MAAAAVCCKSSTFQSFTSLSYFSSHDIRSLFPSSSIDFPQPFKLINSSRLSTVHGTRNLSRCSRGLKRIYSLVDDDPEAQKNSPKEVSFDLKLPRRSLLVSFTCNSCGERSQRLINKLAYERGTVFLQCSGCLQYHKFVDNLGLVVEYNFLEGDGMASKGDQA